MRALAFSSVVLAGCAQLLGIEDTTGSEIATLELERVSVGAQVVAAPLELKQTPVFLVPDASAPGGVRRAPAMTAAPGKWTAAVAGANAALFTAPDLPTAFAHDLALVAPDLRASFIAFEHPSPQPAPTTMEMLGVMLPAPYALGQTYEVLAIGAWTRHVLSGAELPATGAGMIQTTIPYTTFTAITASPPARISAQDQVIVARYVGNDLTGVLIVPPFDQSATTDTISGMMTPLTPDTPYDAAIDPAGLAMRLAAVHPTGSPPALEYTVVAAPGYTVGATTGVVLSDRSVVTTDTMISGSFANPFSSLHWQPVLTYTAVAGRTFMTGGASLTLGASVTASVDPAPGGQLKQLPTSVPTLITIAGTALASDGMTVSLDPAQAIAIDITTDTTGSTWFAAELDEIAVVGMSATRTAVVAVSGPATHLVLPPAVMQHGHTYVIVAVASAGGYTNAATGDLQTFALPMFRGAATSGVFTVAP